jgi:hypothetical protein
VPTIPTVQPTPIVRPVVELRRYRLHPGRRDELIELFDRELVETQEAAGMQVVGQFRDLDRSDHFVWLRAFASMAARRQALEAFYGGPVWARHGLAAASTMIDSDDVLLLHPLAPALSLRVPPARAGDARPRRDVLVVVLGRPGGHGSEIEAAVTSALAPALAASDARTLGVYETEHSDNDYPALPVRDEDVVVWFGTAEAVDGRSDGPIGGGARASTAAWARAVDDLGRLSGGPVAVSRLAPTPRSLLGGDPPS